MLLLLFNKSQMVVLFSITKCLQVVDKGGSKGDAHLKRIQGLLSKSIAALFYQMSLFHHRELSLARNGEDNRS